MGVYLPLWRVLARKRRGNAIFSHDIELAVVQSQSGCFCTSYLDVFTRHFVTFVTNVQTCLSHLTRMLDIFRSVEGTNDSKSV